MNTGPLPLTLYKGTKVATYTPREHILLIDQSSQAEDIPRANPIEAVNISDRLTSEQQDHPSYQHLFVENTQDLGHTSVVKHFIQSEVLWYIYLYLSTLKYTCQSTCTGT